MVLPRDTKDIMLDFSMNYKISYTFFVLFFLINSAAIDGQTILNYGISSMSINSSSINRVLVGSIGSANATNNLRSASGTRGAHGIELPLPSIKSAIASVFVYPQPTSGHVAMDWGTLPIDEVVLSNVEGEIVFKSQVKSAFDFGFLPQGMYIINFLSRGSSLASSKLLIIK